MPRAPKRCQKCGLLIPSQCSCPVGWAANSSRKPSGKWKKVCALVRERSKKHCERCGRFDQSGEVDHILNRARGGTDDLENAQFLCRACHKIKTDEEKKWGRRK